MNIHDINMSMIQHLLHKWFNLTFKGILIFNKVLFQNMNVRQKKKKTHGGQFFKIKKQERFV